MGTGSSTAAEKQRLKGKHGKKQYRVPEVRAKDRFDPAETVVYSNVYEATIDKVSIFHFSLSN